jgi:hypothetical protein
MTHDYRRSDLDPAGGTRTAGSSAGIPGKRTLTESLFEGSVAANPAPLQKKASGPATDDHVHEAAQRGIADGGSRLPHLDIIQRSFGAHDVSSVQAHTGEAATRASGEIGAQAYATGNHVAFAGTPDLHTAAHEAAHVVQQRAGVHLKGGVGEVGDAYERNADEVADRVVRGERAADLLPATGAGAGASVQRRDAGGAQPPAKTQRTAPELLEEAIQVIETALAVATGEIEESPGARRPASGAAATDPGGSGTAGAAATAPPRASPQIVGYLQAGLGGLHALRGAPEDQVRTAVLPILTPLGAPGLGSDAGGAAAAAGPPVQRNTLVLGAPLLAAGPPGWVAYAVLGVATVGIISYVAYQAYQARARERERAEPRVVPRVVPRTDEPVHRGRIQVQGGGLELAFPWARPVPMTKVEGLAGLAGLRVALNRTQLSERDEAFASAAAFITATLHTCPPDISRTFQNRAVRQRGGEERVDIEIRTGTAFA